MTSKGVFITGTDTGVGKTYVSSLMAGSLKASGMDVGVMKPVETGCAQTEAGLFPNDAVALKKAAGIGDPLHLINPYRFSEPLSPNAAARRSDVKIELDKINKAYEELLKRHEFMLVEGAGGIMAPVTDEHLTIDLIRILKLPVIIVAASRLGAINHTLLTVNAALKSGLDVLGIILNHPAPCGDQSAQSNKAEIERFAGVPLLLEVQFSEKENGITREKIVKIFQRPSNALTNPGNRK